MRRALIGAGVLIVMATFAKADTVKTESVKTESAKPESVHVVGFFDLPEPASVLSPSGIAASGMVALGLGGLLASTRRR